MGIFATATVPGPATLDERYNEASALHASAVAIFADTAHDIHESASRFEQVAAEAQEEITRLSAIRDNALDSASAARRSGEQILSLLRGIPT